MSDGCLLAAQNNLADALSVLAATWAFFGVDDLEVPAVPGSDQLVPATDAQKTAASRARIYQDGLPRPASGTSEYTVDELAALRPYVVVEMELENGFLLEADSASSYRAAGRLLARFCDNVEDADLLDGLPTAAAIVAFKQSIGAILDEMSAPAHVATTYFRAERMMVDGPFCTDPDKVETEGAAQEYVVHFEWQGV
jgi:hypothetical protein